ncbi:peptidoglycan D,D-transpeptidase FtsI family protein [Pontiella sulfatireligans]|uniref:Putative peptidoglycan D,D-transpeptidase PenA n=1 Tax=Pontiella sulfatireligans TaxID=2750658 RepID=A0A6C2UJU2_9BACT|nr:penicillin-binding protein 2 [Pontiella sulfatireligans]VGO19681.1 putative peptidoglycan D,D-transpeptidase PenA [Pontiella sulfatireligans]
MAEVRHKGRIALLAVIVLLVFGGIAVRLSFLHLRPAEWVLEPIEEGRMYERKPMGSRGRIVDRNGEILAMDRPAYHVYADPKYIAAHGDADAVCKYLAMEFQIPESEIREKLSDTSRQYKVIKKYVPNHRLKRFTRRTMGVSYTPPGAEDGIYLRGVKFAEVPIRSYPKGPLMAHVVGFANREGVGGAGIELRFNEYLQGKEGRRVTKVDGRRKEIYGERTIDILPEDGATVTLTLDQQLQYVVEKTIEKTCVDFNAKGVWAIVQHVRTGEILAMASYPTYDLNRYGDAPPEWRRNNAIGFNYEPGSTMKAAVVGAAINQGVVKETDLIDCENGYWVYGRRALRDSHGEGTISVAEIIKVSSNIGTAKIALMMGDQMVYECLKSFGFGDRLGLPVPGEERGILYPPKTWSKIKVTRVAIGQGVATTALQVLSMMNAIAYSGVQMKPLLVKRVSAADGSVLREYHPEELGRPLSPDAARRMRTMLARVTEEGGTGTKARVEGYSVGGKTGTAQKINPAGGYFEKNFTSSFVGFLPVENPEIGIIVVADDPGVYSDTGRKTKYYGGTVCGPAFKEIAEFAVRYLRISPDGTRVYVARPDE